MNTNEWKTQVFNCFTDILKAPYGDFRAIGNLANAINDEEGCREVLAWLSLEDVAKSAIQERWQLGDVNLEQLHSLPETTLGYVYSDHMLRNGLTPIQLRIVESDYDYLTVHLTEVHDIWHVVVEADTSMIGETKLQAFVAAQLRRSRLSFAMLAKNLLKTAVDDLDLAEKLMDAATEGWYLGKQALPLFGVRWPNYWQISLQEFQTQWQIYPSNLRG